MRDLLVAIVHQAGSKEQKFNFLREFLQILVLKTLFDRNLLTPLAFVGGTALRILHGLKRFSEDLDFSLMNNTGYDFTSMMSQLKSDLDQNNIQTEYKIKDQKTVQSAMIRFPHLLYDLGLDDHENRKFAVKFEVDTRPPRGWTKIVVPVTHHFVMAIPSFDLSSMMATKIHACFYRKYHKGRDFYDLVWYAGKKITPNFLVLNNAIIQTTGEKAGLNSDNFPDFVGKRLKLIDFHALRKDVEPFLEEKAELKLFDKEVFMNLIK